MNSQQLIQAYTSVLEGQDVQLFGHGDRGCVYDGLNGIFLPSVSDGYETATHKIMLVGRETKSWNFFKQDQMPTTIADGVQRSVIHHQAWLAKELSQSKNDKGNSFSNFMRAFAQRYSTDGLIHSNLYCMALKAGNPSSSKHFGLIKQLSKKLLDQQIEILKPDVIVFANGSASAKYRAEYFPIKGEKSVCFRGRDWSKEQNIANKHLWKFYLYDKIPCYRIQHPSARNAGGKDATFAREYLIDNLFQL